MIRNKRLFATVEAADVASIVGGRHRDPFSILGPHAASHEDAEGVAVRAFVPGAVNAWVVEAGVDRPMELVDEEGFFEAFLPDRKLPISYKLRLQNDLGDRFEIVDPYAFPSLLSDLDLHLFGEGTHYKNYERLGAHFREIHGVNGVCFAVWAPNASRVSVVGDFNFWDGRRHVMRYHPGVGIWDIFVPGLTKGMNYKFELLGPEGELLPLKIDPYGFAFEVRPKTAAIIYDINEYAWKDSDWMAHRAKRNSAETAISVYEVHLGSWIRDPDDNQRLLTYKELGEKLVDYCKYMGFTHIELLPVTEHPFDGSWGYQTLGYFAPTSRFGSPAEFMGFVDLMHQNSIGVLVDWVPAHFPRDDHGLRRFDGTCLYEHLDPRQGEHPDWGTQVFNYGRNEVANFLIGNALFWFEKYHIDGIRVDAVASMLYLDYGRSSGEWIPNKYGGNENLEAVDFIKRLNDLIHERFPDAVTAAEESTAWPGVSRPTRMGGLGFQLKWNMGWMNDTLRYMHRDPVYRKFHQNDLTFSLIYAFNENFILPLSHDEVVHGKGSLLDKMPGDIWQKFANLRTLFCYMYGHPGKKLLFMGGEFGQWREWKHEHSLDWHLLQYDSHKGVQNLVRDLNHLLQSEASLHEVDFHWSGFQWIDFHDHHGSTVVFMRKAKREGDCLIFVCNFTPVVREDYLVGVPRLGFYKEIVNSDSEMYGGSNVGNSGGVNAEEKPFHNLPYSIKTRLPPLACVVFKPPVE